MASGTINFSTNDSRLNGKIEWSSSSNGAVANTSNVSATLYIRRTDSYTTTGNWNGVLNIGGEERSFSVHSGISSGWVRMQGFSKTISHNNDGSGSCWISGYCNGPSGTTMSGVTVSGSQTVTLDKIARYLSITGFSIQTRQINKVVVKWSVSDPRDSTEYKLNNGNWVGSATDGESVASDKKSGTFNIVALSPNTTYKLKIRCKREDSQLYTESNEISFTTYDYAKLTSVPNVNIGSSHTITWNNPNNASTSLKLCKTDNSQIISYGTVTGTSKTITPTASTIYALTPNSNTYKARYIITTTQNGKTYTHSKDFTFTVTNSNPTFTNFDYEDLSGVTRGLTGNNKILIKKYSNLSVKVSSANKAVAKNSATMKTYKLTVGSRTENKNYSSNSDVTFSAFGPESGTIIVYATDSRGNSTSVSKTATFKNYSEPIIKTFEAIRSNNGVGSEVTLKFSGTFWNQNFGAVQNTIVGISYNYKETSSSKFIAGATKITFTISNDKFSGEIKVQGDLAAEGFDVSKTFNIKLNVVDKLSTTQQTITLGAGTPAIAIYKDKVAIGGKYNTENNAALQVNGKINIPVGGPGEAGITVDGKEILRGNDGSVVISSYSTTGKILFRINGNSNIEVSIDNNGILNTNSNINLGSSGTARRGVYGTNGSNDNYFFGGGATGTDAGFAEIATGDGGNEPIYARQYLGSVVSGGRVKRTATLLDGNGNTVFPGTLKARTNENIYSAKSLYENTSGSNGTITLSESVANFTYIEIFYFNKKYGTYSSVQVYSPNNKKVNLHTSNVFSGDKTAIIDSRKIKISGTSISNDEGINNDYGSLNTWNNSINAYNRMYITKIIGYR